MDRRYRPPEIDTAGNPSNPDFKLYNIYENTPRVNKHQSWLKTLKNANNHNYRFFLEPATIFLDWLH